MTQRAALMPPTSRPSRSMRPTLAKAEQAQAGLLPTADLAHGCQPHQRSTQSMSLPPTTAPIGNAQRHPERASQPLYRPANWASYEQGKKQLDLAQAQLTQADQDLIVRVSQAYFDVLAAHDSLTFVTGQKTAVAEQLASAKRNFEVGTSTITDTREAQARFDLVMAQEIAAENDLRVKKFALDQLVGKSNATPKPLQPPVVIAGPCCPDDVNRWVQQVRRPTTPACGRHRLRWTWPSWKPKKPRPATSPRWT